MSIQLDYGGFDPDFLGVSTRFSNRRAWELHQAFHESPQPIRPDCATDDEKFQWLSVTTVLSHEVRHFHDFLLSPYAARLFERRVAMLLNAWQLLPFLLDDPGNCLPVPIQHWCGLDEDARRRELSFLPPRTDGQPWSAKPVPHLPDLGVDPAGASGHVSGKTGVEALIRATVAHQHEIAALVHNPAKVGDRGAIQPWQVFELAGIAVQMQDVWLTYGADETQFFADYLSRSAEPYSVLLRVLQQVWSRRGLSIKLLTASAIAFWCICGSYARDGWSACPSVRFARLLNYLRNCDAATLADTDGAEAFDRWSAATSLSTVAEGLDEAGTMHGRLEAMVARATGAPDVPMLGSDTGATIVATVRGVAAASRHMADYLRRDPDDYLDPNIYLSQSVVALANPVWRIVCSGFALAFPRPEVEMAAEGRLWQWAYHQEGKPLVHSYIERYALSAHSFLDPATAIDFATIMGLADFMFASRARSRMDVQLAGNIFFREEGGITPVEIPEPAAIVVQ